ncbi:MAG: hypothetical protein GY906_03390 [bacterium]|nr:hypothetical protein [bacterium]
MTPEETPLIRAVRAYKQRAAADLQPDQVEKAIQLLKALNHCLPKKNLLLASREEIKNVGMQVLDGMEARQQGGFLTAELNRFYDVALDAGLISYHPLRETARLRDKPAEVDDVKPDMTQRTAEVTAKLVAGIIKDGLQAGMMVSPLAGHLTGRASRTPMLERVVSIVSGRWEALANRSRLVLSILQIAIPLVTFVLAIQAVFDPSNPMMGGTSGAMDSGNTVRMLRGLVTEIDWSQEDFSEVRDLDDLAERWGGPLGPGAKNLRLLRIVPDAQAIYLKHDTNNAVVIITPDLLGVFSRGRWRMRE